MPGRKRGGRGMPDDNEQVNIDTENARTGYQVAVNLWVYEGTTIWA